MVANSVKNVHRNLLIAINSVISRSSIQTIKLKDYGKLNGTSTNPSNEKIIFYSLKLATNRV